MTTDFEHLPVSTCYLYLFLIIFDEVFLQVFGLFLIWLLVFRFCPVSNGNASKALDYEWRCQLKGLGKRPLRPEPSPRRWSTGSGISESFKSKNREVLVG